MLSGRNGSGDRARGKWIWDFCAALYGYDTASQYNSHTGTDVELEIQVLYRAEEIWNPLEAGRGIFSVLENINHAAFKMITWRWNIPYYRAVQCFIEELRKFAGADIP